MGATGEEHNFVNSSFEIHLVRRFAGMDQTVAVMHVSLGLRAEIFFQLRSRRRNNLPECEYVDHVVLN